jgi:signal transduction histidine kinase
MLQQVFESGEAILSRDVHHDQRFDANHSIFRTNIRSALAVPLRGQDSTLGVLHLDKRDSRRPFDEEDLHLAVIVAQQVAATLHNARLFEEVSRANRELESARDEILRWNQDLEKKVADRTREVAELNRHKDQLLGMVAHDLRTPLAGLLGFAEVAIVGIDGGIEPAKTREDLDIIRTTALEMSELLNDLLDVARIESGKLSVDPRDIDLAALIRAAAPRYARWAEHKQIQFDLHVPAGVQPVCADPKRIQQVLNNLVSNAIKFSNPGALISLGVRREAELVLVSVADTGQGIESVELDKIFASYEQASARATAGEDGSGLGLSIAKKLIEHHGGKIWVESRPGVGSKFTFSLPSTCAISE